MKRPKTKPTEPGEFARGPTSHPGDSPSLQELRTMASLFTRGRHSETATFAQAMTVRFPMHALSWMVLGAVLKRMGQSTNALAAVQKAVALSPGNAEAHNNLGTILEDLGRLGEAEASYGRALEIKPDYAEAHF